MPEPGLEPGCLATGDFKSLLGSFRRVTTAGVFGELVADKALGAFHGFHGFQRFHPLRVSTGKEKGGVSPWTLRAVVSPTGYDGLQIPIDRWFATDLLAI